MAGNFAPPPTWAPVILERDDPATGQKRGSFNPEWLKWFVELTANVPTMGGGGGSGGSGTAIFANVVGPNPPGFTVNNIALFDNPVSGPPPSPFAYIKDSGVQLDAIYQLFADDEGLSGVIDGVNDTFTSVNNPDPVASMIVYHNGPPLLFSQDFTVSAPGNVITFNVPPIIGDYLLAFYRYKP